MNIISYVVCVNALARLGKSLREFFGVFRPPLSVPKKPNKSKKV